MEGCLACDLTSGKQHLPGGTIYATEHWTVEHCVGPLGVGTLIVKPLRHCLHIWDLDADESTELGPLLRQVAVTINQILEPDQVYVCLWSHADWVPGHIHFVVQPVWNQMRRDHEHPGPGLQTEMFHGNALPPPEEVETFAAKARDIIRSLDRLDRPT